MSRNPKKYNDLVKVWNELKAEAAGFFRSESDVEEMDGVLARAQWARPLQIKEVPTPKLNRCGDIYSGPLFVSKKHPWPRTKAGPMLPVLQLNLGKWSRIMRMDFGKGMLQVWATQDHSHIVKVLPIDDVKKEYLVDKIPDSILRIENDYFGDTPLTWNADGKSWAITGYGDRRFVVPIWEDSIGSCLPIFKGQILKKFLGVPTSIEELFGVPISVKMDKQKRMKVGPLRKKFRQLAHEVAREYQPLGLCIGGSFSMIQYSPEDRPPVLLNIEADMDIYLWGDFGNAQIFYEKQPDGTFKYSFAWSCT